MNALRTLRLKTVRFLAAIVCSVVVSGCKVDLPHKLAQDNIWTVTAYDRGRPGQPQIVAKGSSEQKRVLAWATDNITGWKLAFATFSPDVLVTGPSFRLDIHSDFIVFGAGRLHYSKDIRASDYESLRQALALEPGS